MAGVWPNSFSVCVVFTWILSMCSAMASDICSHMTYDYNVRDGRSERMVSFKSCEWGCCWKFSDPCCSAPVGLIVGCIVGGVIVVALVMVIVCCCCCCKSRPRTQGQVVRYPGGGASGQGSGVHFSSGASQNSDSAISTSLPPGVYLAPPSYDEVMAGETNHAYKPDTPTRLYQSSEQAPPAYDNDMAAGTNHA